MSDAAYRIRVLGVLGGGQLGRLIALDAARLGFDVHVFDPDPDCPAARVAAQSTTADFEDEDAVRAFAGVCDVVTCEFENVPAKTLEAAAAAGALVRPGPRSFAVAQDRIREKAFFESVGATVAPHRPVSSREEAVRALRDLGGGPALLKTARDGYDGKGQRRLAPGADAARAFDALGGVPCVMEGLVTFEREFSVVIARWADGRTVFYEPAENVHEDGVLRSSRAPADLHPAAAEAAREVASRAAEALDHVGVMAVEFFDLGSGAPPCVNEMAPRVHNSGHWTFDACDCGQFEQHVRAIFDLPPGSCVLRRAAHMTNVLGEEIVQADLMSADVIFSHYGKRNMRSRRKMGHYVTLHPLS